MERGLWVLPVASSMKEGFPLQVVSAGAPMAQEQVLVQKFSPPPEAKAWTASRLAPQPSVEALTLAEPQGRTKVNLEHPTER